MLILGLLAAASIATTVVGTALQIRGQRQQAAALQDAENQRRQQQTLDAQRARRQVVRDSLRARALASATAAAQGASGGSGLQGGYAQIAGQAGRGILAINQNEAIGNNIFDANARAGRAGTLAATGAGLSTLGNTILSNLGTIQRVGTYAINKP